LGGQVTSPLTALTSTVRFLDHTFTDWCYHHLRLFDYLIIYVDDPKELGSARIPRVDARIEVSVGAQFKRGSVQNTLMHRQDENALAAVRRCCELGIRWLCHLDADELLVTNESHLSWTSVDTDVGLIVFKNHEVCPVWEADNPFRDCSYFKLSGRVPFCYYVNGKAAVRVNPNVRPWAAHWFVEHVGRVETATWACVLHYSPATFERWLRKYRCLGPFGDHWYEDPTLPIMPFHTLSRDICANEGKSNQIEAARRFFGEFVWSEERLAEGLRSGIIQQFAPLADLPETCSRRQWLDESPRIESV
jgi:hypothetical protein